MAAFVCLGVLATAFGGCGAAKKLGGGDPLTLVWYGLAHQGPFGDPTYVPLREGVTLAGDEGVQLYLSVRPDAYLYVLHQKVDGTFVVMHPTQQSGFNALMPEGRVRTLPGRGFVYRMEIARGTEAIYIIAARKPIETVDGLTREMRILFVSAQSLATEIPADRIRAAIPENVTWELDLDDPPPIALTDQSIPLATSVASIGAVESASRQIVTTAGGDTYGVDAEKVTGDKVVARVIRLRRIVRR